MNHHPKPTAALLAEIKQLKAALGVRDDNYTCASVTTTPGRLE